MQRWIVVLGILLVVQLMLAVAVNLTGEDYGAFEPQEKLLAFDVDAVDGLSISDSEQSLELRKHDGRWRLPASGDFPADGAAVERLLDKLAGLARGWPVATTAGAAKRFKVDNDGFERKLTLLAGGATRAVLYVGTSPGLRKVHVRPEADEAVYAVDFNAWEAAAKADDWIDKEILKLDPAEVTRVEMPGLVLQRDGAELEIADLGDQEHGDGEAIRALIGALTGLRVQSLLGPEAKPEYGQDEPVHELEVTRTDGAVLRYRFSKPEGESYYVLKRSDLDPYFKVPEFAVVPIRDAKREQLVKTEEAPGEDPRGAAVTEAEQGSTETRTQ